MRRIPEEEVARIKREVLVEDLARARGVELVRKGSDLHGLCPFHDDRSPSLSITPSKNVWHCLGACQAGGSVIDWVMRAEGVSVRHALELLMAGYTGAGSSSAKRSRVAKLECPFDSEASDGVLLSEVATFYNEALVASAEGLEYLGKRGLRDEEAIERFRLGYGNRTLGYRLPAKTRVAGARVRGRFEQLGIYRASGHEHFSGCLTIPIFSESGEVVEMYGRKIGDGLKPDAPRHLYLPGPHRGVWNWEALRDHREIILCEALLDGLTFWVAGYRNVTASYGIEGFTPSHWELFRRYLVERVLLAYDADAAGDRAAAVLAEKLQAEGIECFRIEFPRGMDANEYALRSGSASEALGAAIRRAAWLGTGVRPAVAVVPHSEPATETEAAHEVPPSLVAEAAEPVAITPEPEPVAPLLASRVPALPTLGVEFEIVGEDVWLWRGDRRYRVRGLWANPSAARISATVLAIRGEGAHTDAFDLSVDRNRLAFAKRAEKELGVKEETIAFDLGRVLLQLELLLDARLSEARAVVPTVPSMTDAEREEAMALLRDPRLLERILEDYTRCGIVGEETNKLVGYLTAISRKLEDPLAVIIQSSSAAGKTALMEAILAFVPDEERVKYSAVTGQSLFYMSDQDLRNKVLALVEEEGAERASYALKLLQSEGELTIASTGKDPQTGRLVTHEYRVEGPVALLLTTTAIEVDEELQNRCIVLTVDEDREQTRAIHRQQRERRTLEGMLARRRRDRVVVLHRNAQRLLRPVSITNPYARRLTFLDDKTRTRRDHEKYLTMMDTIAFAHQYQRQVKTTIDEGEVVRYIEVELSDIELANRLAGEVLGRSLDELAPKTRRLLEILEAMVEEGCETKKLRHEEYRFTQRAVRERSGWSATQVKIHLQRLVDLEYVLVHRGGRGQQFVYELVYDGGGKDGRPFLVGLIDVEKLRARAYDPNRFEENGGWSEENEGWSEGGPGVVLAWSGGGPSGENGEIVNNDGAMSDAESDEAKNAYTGGEAEESLSYVYAGRRRGEEDD